MTGARLDVQWSPVHPDKFITWGTEIYLYETLPKKDAPKTACVDITESTVAHLLAIIANHHYVKCVDIYPQPGADVLLAVGQANGKVVLTCFGPSMYDGLGLAGLELAPKHARQCNTVAWNPSHTSMVAAGLDKYRTDHSVLLWDVQKCLARPTHSGDAYVRPVAELGLSDTAHSLAWLLHQPRTLVVGMNNKHLKLVDLRDPAKAANSAPTKAVYGVCIPPHNDHQLASYYENQIAIWDLRGFEKPVLTLPQAKTITKIVWCPTRHNLLGSLQRDSAVIHLHDVQQSMDETEPSVLERSVQPRGEETLTSFSWHPTHDNRLITTTLSGSLADYTVFERMTVNWSHGSHLVWTFGRRTLKLISDRDPIYSGLEDIATKIKRRALAGYGLKEEIWQNGDLAEDQNLKNLWHWLYCSRNLVQDGYIEANGSTRHPGVRSVLGMDIGTTIANKSELVLTPWTENSQTSVRLYRSEDRDKALQLCGWMFDRDLAALPTFLETVESEGEEGVCRAAAIAVFNLRLRLAIEILTRGAQTYNDRLTIVAMALSGFTDSRSSMWRELCMSQRAQISNPYLRAMFAFLTLEGDNYDTVLNEPGLAVEDRVALACLYLSNARLYEYLSQLTETLISSGDLGGVLLTGAGSECVSLLQHYLDRSGDVQSACLIAACTFPSQLLDKDSQVQEWIASYRNLLNSWHMWNHRARVDIALSTRNPGTKPVQQVFVSCNFCGKSVSAYMQASSLSRGQLARLGATSNRLKMTSCPNCRKPQPRCAVCLVNMGTPAYYDGNPSPSPSRPSTTPLRLSPFNSWYTWCQTCRHGGHASHITQWFREHSECPVTACSCRCLSLDTSSKMSSLASVA
ncbi:GATOR complex protein MIOS-B-like [Homalodisca vitripennis]|uniref:GATOR complex protein MIOS-B-like n=2 Tax=Homalodisca vitripennis TaxID=197043 RepID=UPI001EEA685A|nr:GATOR complex protein MIOS-B-like [Homalodisca vitripennis]XP_046677874.1 GATOR complex protein MIOS-B-like [Homalodisca vitripennis]